MHALNACCLLGPTTTLPYLPYGPIIQAPHTFCQYDEATLLHLCAWDGTASHTTWCSTGVWRQHTQVSRKPSTHAILDAFLQPGMCPHPAPIRTLISAGAAPLLPHCVVRPQLQSRGMCTTTHATLVPEASTTTMPLLHVSVGGYMGGCYRVAS